MTETITLNKDDSDLAAMIEQGKELRRKQGISEPREPFNIKEATYEWHRMQQVRTAPWTYYVVIEYTNGAYHAHALSFPEVTAQADTVEKVKERMAAALQDHFTTLRRAGKPVPVRENRRVETVQLQPVEEDPHPAPATNVTLPPPA